MKGTGPYVFVTERGGPLTADTVRKLVKRAGEVAGLPFPIHPQMLRHATGYELANEDHVTPVPFSSTWDTVTFSTRCGIRSWRQGGLMVSGLIDSQRSLIAGFILFDVVPVDIFQRLQDLAVPLYLCSIHNRLWAYPDLPVLSTDLLDIQSAEWALSFL